MSLHTDIHTCEWILVPKATQEQSVGKMSKLWMQGGTNGACGAVRVNVACKPTKFLPVEFLIIDTNTETSPLKAKLILVSSWRYPSRRVP